MTSESASPLLVRDLMTVGVATCPPNAPVDAVARLLLEKNLEAVIVLDPEEGHAMGYVSQEELVRAYDRENAAELKAENVMRDGIPQAPPDIPLAVAAQLMRDQGVRVLFLMHHAAGVVYPAAYISYRHILRHLSARTPEELRDLGIQAERKSPIEIFIERRDAAREAARRGARKP